jgi:transcriptional regulator with XRE-family HTH domain
MRTATVTSPTATRTGRPDYPEMGERLREARRARNLSLRTLAERLGVSPSLISQIETGRANPSVSTLYAIAAELDVSLDELLFNDRRPAEPAVPARAEVPSGGTMAQRRPSSAPPTDTGDPARIGRQLGTLTTMSIRHRILHDLRGRRGVEPRPTHSSGIRDTSGVDVPSGRLQHSHRLRRVLEPATRFRLTIGPASTRHLDQPVTAIWFVLVALCAALTPERLHRSGVARERETTPPGAGSP